MNGKNRSIQEKQKLVQQIERSRSTGTKLEQACKEAGIFSSQFYDWRKKHADQPVEDSRKIKQRNGDERHLKIENQRLKMIVAEQALDIQALKEWSNR